MNSIYVQDWKKHGELVRSVIKVFNKWEIQMDYGIWCPGVWTGMKQETLCVNALLHVTMESQALQAFDSFKEFNRDFNAVASKRGCYWERGFHWSFHLYPTKRVEPCSKPAKV